MKQKGDTSKMTLKEQHSANLFSRKINSYLYNQLISELWKSFLHFVVKWVWGFLEFRAIHLIFPM